jgi:hypothetical protein
MYFELFYFVTVNAKMIVCSDVPLLAVCWKFSPCVFAYFFLLVRNTFCANLCLYTLNVTVWVILYTLCYIFYWVICYSFYCRPCYTLQSPLHDVSLWRAVLQVLLKVLRKFCYESCRQFSC